MQGKEKEIYTAEIKLSKLNYQLKEQQEEIGNKDKVIQALKAEIESYEAGVNNIKTMTMGQLNIENKILKSTGRKIITITNDTTMPMGQLNIENKILKSTDRKIITITNNTIVSISFTRAMITITIILEWPYPRCIESIFFFFLLLCILVKTFHGFHKNTFDTIFQCRIHHELRN